MTARGTGTRLAVLLVTFLVVLGTVAPAAAVPSSPVADSHERVSAPWSSPTYAQTEEEEAPNPSAAVNFEIIGGGQTSQGDLAVTVANGTVTKDQLNVFYEGSTSTPLNLSNGGVQSASLTEKGYLSMVLDPNQAAYTNGPMAIRVTEGTENTSYGSTADGYRAVMTLNYASLSVTNATGSPLGPTPLVYYNASTNETLGMTFTDMTGRFYQHCRGVIDGTDCVLPSDTTTASTVFTPSQFSQGGPNGGPAPITDTVGVDAFNMPSSNGTGKATVTPGTHATLATDTPAAPLFVEATPLSGPYLQLQEIVVTERATGTVVHDWNRSTGPTMAPFFAEPSTQYEVAVTVNDSGTLLGPFTYSYVTPTKGMSEWRPTYSTGSTTTAPVTGQVLNASGDAIHGVVVAEVFTQGGSGGVFRSARVVNATATDANGKFEMRLPVTKQTTVSGSNLRYQLRVVSNETSDSGAPLYYPTTFTNDGSGYAVLDGKTVIPPLTVQQGGLVDVSVRNETGALPIQLALAELGQTTARNGRTVKTDGTTTFAQTSFGSSMPASASVSMVSPTSDAGSNLAYNVWGIGQSYDISHLCWDAVSVSQGATTASSCTLENAGTLNLSVTRYDSAIQRSTATTEPVGDWSFFFENTLVVRNTTTDDVVAHVGPDSALGLFLGGGLSPSNVSVPLPQGDYTLELYPRGEFLKRTDVTHTQSVGVTAGGTTDLTLTRGDDFVVERTPGRFPGELVRSSDNDVAVSAFDPATDAALSDTDVSVTGQFLHGNGTEASGAFALSYNDSGSATPVFENGTLRPSALGVDAGRYDLAITVTHTTASETYNTTRRFPVRVADFSTSLELSRRTVGTGGDVSGVVRAFDTSGDSPTAISADASNITITVRDENEKQVSQQTASSGLTDGKTAISVTMPSRQGLYELSVRVESNSGDQAVATQWVRVSDLTVDATTPKDSYGTDDTVNLTVSVTNASNGDAVRGAGVSVTLNGNQSANATDANGEHTFTLSPSRFAREGAAWQGNEFNEVVAEVVVTKETPSGVVRQTTAVGFEVSAVTAFVEPRRDSFGADETAFVDVYTPPDETVQSVTLKRLNDDQPGAQVTEVASGYHELDLGTLPVGDYTATVEVATDGGTQRFEASFSVESFIIEAETAKFRYDTGESIPVDVTLRYTNGSVVSGQQVNATLFYADSRIEKASGSATTGSDGTVTIPGLSSDETGQHFVEVEAGGQKRQLGVQVSSLNATLLDGAGGDPVEGYTWAPGTDQTVTVDVDVGGSPAADGTTVTAFVDAYESRIELGSGETTSGEAAIPVTVPDEVAAGSYGLTVRVQTASGATGFAYGFVEIAGGSALTVELSTDDRVYAPGDTVSYSATVTDGSGAPVSGKRVEFTLASENSPERSLDATTTDASGVAELTDTLAADKTNGEYVVRAKLAETPSIKDVSGFLISSYRVDVTPNETVYAPGDTVGLDVNVTDSSGSTATATDGVIHIVSPGGNERLVSVTPSGGSPYEVSFDVPDDGNATGSYSVDVMMRNDNDFGVGSTLVEVASATESANLSVPETVTAGETATVTVNGSLTTTGTLTVFSPGADGTAYRNESVPLSPTDTPVDVTLDSAGVYVFKLETPTVGTITEIVTVEPAADAVPSLVVGPDLSSTSVNFSTTEDVYVRTDQAGATATIVGPDETFDVPLTQQDGETYYGVLSKQRAADLYLVRLDTANATAVNETVIEVEA